MTLSLNIITNYQTQASHFILITEDSKFGNLDVIWIADMTLDTPDCNTTFKGNSGNIMKRTRADNETIIQII